MNDFGHIDAVRCSLDRMIEKTGEYRAKEIRIPEPSDPWHGAIIWEAYRLSKFSEQSAIRAIEIYYEQVKIESQTAGRLVEIAHPVQLSGGVLKAIRLVNEIEEKLDHIDSLLDYYSRQATFGSTNLDEEVSRAGLNLSQKLPYRTRLFVHTYLWIMWTHESLKQANQFGGQLIEGFTLENFSVMDFPYIAHPPLIVATIACPTMLEEVGAEYLNSYVDGIDHHPDETSATRVLNDLENHFPGIEEYDTKSIHTHVIDARNNVSHYVTKRGDVVDIEDFESFYNAVIEGNELVDAILHELIERPVSNFRNQLDQSIID